MKAFTLAEILITLVIIGTIFAITIPLVVNKYRKQTVENKLKKFYSVMNQAIEMSIAEHGQIDFELQNSGTTMNSEYITKWYNEYLTKYIKSLKKEKFGSAYYQAIFADGSAFNSYLSSENVLYIFYCLNFNKCPAGQYNGKDHFLFVYNKQKQQITPAYSGQNINTLKQKCYAALANEGKRWHCTALIEANGWKIPDDYPYIK